LFVVLLYLLLVLARAYDLFVSCIDLKYAACVCRSNGDFCCLTSWSDSPGDFAPIGDDDGLLIIVRRGREWHPDTSIFAQQPTFKLVARTDRGEVVIAS
jgi:hypothetical protein